MARFKIGHSFCLDDREFKILSGAIHYFRVQPEDWYHSLYNLKALGFNTVETYLPWNMHEPQKRCLWLPRDFRYWGIFTDSSGFGTLCHYPPFAFYLRGVGVRWSAGLAAQWKYAHPLIRWGLSAGCSKLLWRAAAATDSKASGQWGKYPHDAGGKWVRVPMGKTRPTWEQSDGSWKNEV